MRLDRYLADQGLVASRTRAAALVKEGKVLINNKPAKKVSAEVLEEDDVEVLEQEMWVARSAHKLIAALDEWNISVKDAYCADIGASTGGFTQVLVARGARSVEAFDVGHDQMHQLIQDLPQVINHEGINARNLTKEDVQKLVQLAVIDVSFISLELILPAVKNILAPAGQIIALVKPQFEVQRNDLNKQGVLKDQSKYEEILQKITDCAQKHSLKLDATIKSPIMGAKGNEEFLVLLTSFVES